MRRTKGTKKADFILTADWHLREDIPICRSDDFQTAQWKKVYFIHALQRQHQCPVLHAGDLFDHWKSSPYLLSQTILHLPIRFWTVYGNHDLPRHNLELANKSGVYTLISGGHIFLLASSLHLEPVHWGEEPAPSVKEDLVEERRILVWHVMTYKGNRPWPNCTDLSAREILEKYPQFDLIVTGHNHRPFTERLDGRLLVNPGTITRQEADQVDLKPRVYLYYAKQNKVVPVYLPIEEGVISREHIERIEKRDARIAAFVERLNTDWEMDVSFERNLERFEKENRVRKSVMGIVRKAIEK